MSQYITKRDYCLLWFVVTRFTDSTACFLRDSSWSSYNFGKFKYPREELISIYTYYISTYNLQI